MMTEITSDLVRTLIARQFPQWRDLPVRPVEPGGWDNRTFRLGDRLAVRLPFAARYAAQVAKEQYWLPRLAPQLPVAIPKPRGVGRPDAGYPWSWSVLEWQDGTTVHPAEIVDRARFAGDIARFLRALQAADAREGPPAGEHNFFRGGPLEVHAGETEAALSRLADLTGRDLLATIWDEALTTDWDRPPVWVHGDFAADNLLQRRGRLTAVIDFGSSGVGDPACDLAIAWTLLDAEGRRIFRDALAPDAGTWARGRGWALWKALITVTPGHDGFRPDRADEARRTLAHIKADFLLSAGEEQ